MKSNYRATPLLETGSPPPSDRLGGGSSRQPPQPGPSLPALAVPPPGPQFFRPRRPDCAPVPPSPSLPGAVARGGRADWRRCERGPEPAALIGQSLSAEPRSPASRWGKLGRDREEPELRARIPQVGAWQVGVRTLKQGPGGKDLAPGRVRRALPRELRRNPSALPQGAKTGHLLTETEPSSSRDAGPPRPPPTEKRGSLTSQRAK